MRILYFLTALLTCTTLAAQYPQININGVTVFSTNADVCYNGDITLHVEELPNENWVWTKDGDELGTGSALSLVEFTEEKQGEYQATLTEESETQIIQFNLKALPIKFAELEDDYSVCGPTELIISAPEGYSYLWSNESTSSSINVSIEENSSYQITITDELQCESLDEINIEVEDEFNMSTQITQLSYCERALLNFQAEQLDAKFYPLLVYGTLDKEEILLASMTTDNESILVNSGIIKDVYVRTNLGCIKPLGNIEIPNYKPDFTIDMSISEIPGNCCTSLVRFEKIQAEEGGQAVTIYASFDGEERILASITGSEETVGLSKGMYTNVYAKAGLDCIYDMQDFEVLDNGPIFIVPSMQSLGKRLAIQQASPCPGSSITMMAPAMDDQEEWNWTGPNGLVAEGPELTISNFSQENAGTYRAKRTLPFGEYTEDKFVLHYVSLGEDVLVCDEESIEFNLPEGPEYTWSTGAESNGFTATFLESTNLQVIVKNEFGCVFTDQIFVEVAESQNTIMETISFCPNEDFELNAPEGYDSYEWGSGETESSITLNLDQSVTFYLKAINEGACSDMFEYNLEMTHEPIDIALNLTSNPNYCQRAFLDIEVFNQENIFPVEVYGDKGEGVVLLASMTGSYESISVNAGVITDVMARSVEGCEVQLEDLVIPEVEAPYSVSVDIQEIPGNCCNSFVNFSVARQSGSFPVLVYATFDGEEKLLASITGDEESLSLSMGSYTDVYARANTDCIFQMEDFKVEFNGEIFEGPSIRSFGTQLPISEATICPQGTVTLIAAGGVDENWIWVGPNGFSASGMEATITNFSAEKAGGYRARGTMESGEVVDYRFDLFHIDLGEAETSCGNIELSYELPEGPAYQWSTGETSHVYQNVLTETETISVIVSNEFGCTWVDQKEIEIKERETIILDAITICEGNEQVLSLPAEFEYEEIQWNNGQSNVDKITVYPEVGENYSAIIIDANGCESEFHFVFQIIDDFDMFVSFSLDCEDERVVLTSVSDNPLAYPIQVFAFDGFSDNLLVEITEPDTEVLAPALGLFTQVRAINEAGCYVDLPDIINGEPTTEVEEMDLIIACGEQEVTLEVDQIYENYSWSNGSTSSSIDFLVQSSTSIYLSASNEGECEKQYVFPIQLVDPFTVEYNIPTQNGCSEIEVEFAAQSEGSLLFPIDVFGVKNSQFQHLATLTGENSIHSIETGNYAFVYAVGPTGCESIMEPLNGEINQFEADLEVLESSSCLDAAIRVSDLTSSEDKFPMRLTAFYPPANTTIFLGMLSEASQVFEISPGSYFNVTLTNDQGCIAELSNFTAEATAFESTMDIKSGANCSNAEMSVSPNLTEPDNYPMRVTAFYPPANTRIFLGLFSEPSQVIDLDPGSYFQVQLSNSYGCIAELPNFVVEDDFLEASIETENTNSCEQGMITLTVQSDNPNAYPMTLRAQDDQSTESMIIATITQPVQEIMVDEGVYVQVQLESSNGCILDLPDFISESRSFQADISVKNPTSPCSSGKIIITAHTDDESAYPMNLTAYYGPADTWIQIGVLTEMNQEFAAEPGAYYDVQLKNQYDCIVEFAQFVIQPHESPCTEAKPDASITDMVFLDQNINGIFDNGEKGISDVRITLYDIDGHAVKSVLSKFDGRYLLDGLEPGDYYMHFDLPGYLSATAANIGDDDSMDSDVDGSNGPSTTPWFNVGPNEVLHGISAGFASQILPLSWNDIKASHQKDHNLIEWSTESEESLSHFEIEKATDDKLDFTSIAKIESTGNIYESAKYQYQDFSLEGETQFYYRIKSLDLNGKANYSEVVFVEIRTNNPFKPSMTMYPNPTTNFVVISLDNFTEEEGVNAIFYNNLGQRVKSIELLQTETRVDLLDLNPGTYQLVLDADGNRLNQTLVISR